MFAHKDGLCHVDILEEAHMNEGAGGIWRWEGQLLYSSGQRDLLVNGKGWVKESSQSDTGKGTSIPERGTYV